MSIFSTRTTPAAATTTPATTTTTTVDDGTKVIATPSYSKRVARDLAKLEKETKALEERKKEIDAIAPRLKTYEDGLALVKAGKIKEFLQGTGLTREQIATLYGFDTKTGKEITTAEAKKIADGKKVEEPSQSNAELKAINDKLAAIEKERADEKKAAEDKKKADETATFEANKKWFLDQISEQVTKATDDSLAYTALALKEDPEDVRAFMWEVVEAWCKANPTIKQPPAPEVFAKAVEADYEKEAARYSKVTKKKPEEKAPDGKKTTETAITQSDKALTPEQALRKIKAEWKAKSQQAVKN